MWDHEIAHRFGPGVAAARAGVHRGRGLDRTRRGAPASRPTSHHLASPEMAAPRACSWRRPTSCTTPGRRSPISGATGRGVVPVHRRPRGPAVVLRERGRDRPRPPARPPGRRAVATPSPICVPFPTPKIGLLDGIATTRAIRRFRPDPIPDADLHQHPVRRHPGAVGLEPPAVPLPRAPRRTQGRTRRRPSSAQSFRAGWDAKRAEDGYDAGLGRTTRLAQGPHGAAMQRFVDELRADPGGRPRRAWCATASRTSPKARRCTPRARTCCSPPGRSATAA